MLKGGMEKVRKHEPAATNRLVVSKNQNKRRSYERRLLL